MGGNEHMKKNVLWAFIVSCIGVECLHSCFKIDEPYILGVTLAVIFAMGFYVFYDMDKIKKIEKEEHDNVEKSNSNRIIQQFDKVIETLNIISTNNTNVVNECSYKIEKVFETMEKMYSNQLKDLEEKDKKFDSINVAVISIKEKNEEQILKISEVNEKLLNSNSLINKVDEKLLNNNDLLNKVDEKLLISNKSMDETAENTKILTELNKEEISKISDCFEEYISNTQKQMLLIENNTKEIQNVYAEIDKKYNEFCDKLSGYFEDSIDAQDDIKSAINSKFDEARDLVKELNNKEIIEQLQGQANMIITVLNNVKSSIKVLNEPLNVLGREFIEKDELLLNKSEAMLKQLVHSYEVLGQLADRI